MSGGGRSGRSPSLEEDGCGSQAGGGGAGSADPAGSPVSAGVDLSRTQEARGRCMDLAGRRAHRASAETPLLWCFRTRRGAGGRGSDSAFGTWLQGVIPGTGFVAPFH